MSKLSKSEKKAIKNIVNQSSGLNIDEIAFKVIRSVGFYTEYNTLISYISKRLEKSRSYTFEELGIEPIGKKTYTVNICHVNDGTTDVSADVNIIYGNYPRVGDISKIQRYFATGEEVYDEDLDEYVDEYSTVSGTSTINTPTGESFEVGGLEGNTIQEKNGFLDGVMYALLTAQGKWADEDCRVVFNISTDAYDYGSVHTYDQVFRAIENYSTNKNWEFTIDCRDYLTLESLSDELGIKIKE